MKRLRYVMVGGGPGAFIGQVHRKALALDGETELVGGAFSRSLDRTLQMGRELGLSDERLYADAKTMVRAESAREDGADFAVVCSTNDSHFPACMAFVERGIPVVCDKPLTMDLAQAEALERAVSSHDVPFGVTYTYSGYAMVKQARQLVRDGALGRVRFVNCEYPQDWWNSLLENEGHKQAEWRADPKRVGGVATLGDVGTHVEHLSAYVTGLTPQRLLARLDSLVPGRSMDDTASILVDYPDGARGMFWATQCAVGNVNGLRLRVYGEKGGLEWFQEDPERLLLHRLDGATEILRRARTPMGEAASRVSRTPAGHPEGYFIAFANIYGEFVRALRLREQGVDWTGCDFPGVAEGARGMRFIDRCLKSSRQGAVWVSW